MASSNNYVGILLGMGNPLLDISSLVDDEFLTNKVVECHRRKLLMAPLTLTLALRRLVRKMTAEGAALQGS
ncbi:hypothetical protein F2Q69_00031338 [Brassica cretica]|uniref:Adenosine kinase n=1 Tax=Brassica cretica TaxID=69181 RepID=A0A8S9S803_BRACR|nr:hypothetical protein F2Q69_00031338 [Brassica cretica]